MRDKISSHIHYISVSSDHWCSAKYRKTINWHDYSPEQHISGFPSFAQFCSQSIWSQSVTESRPLNQNELRGFFTICIFRCGNAILALDVRTPLFKLHYDVCVFEIFAVVYINVIPLETRDTTGNFIRLRLEYVCLWPVCLNLISFERREYIWFRWRIFGANWNCRNIVNSEY